MDRTCQMRFQIIWTANNKGYIPHLIKCPYLIQDFDTLYKQGNLHFPELDKSTLRKFTF
jgi:hypothetical protein